MIDHILGTLYGMALGDAMGMPSELLSRWRIREIFGRITTGSVKILSQIHFIRQ